MGGHDYPNLGMCWGLFAQVLILLQTLFIHLVVKHICDRRQLLQLGLTQSYLWALSVSIRNIVKQIVTRGMQLTKVVLWASLGTTDLLLFLLPGLGMNTQLQRLLSHIVEMMHRISRTSLLLALVYYSSTSVIKGISWQPGH